MRRICSKMILVSCDLCGSNKFKTLYKISLNIYIKGGSFKTTVTNGFCKECGFVFQNPRLSSKEMTSFYSRQIADSVYLNDEQKSGIQSRVEQIKFLKQYLPINNLSALDIGSSDGYFLYLLKQNGWKVLGVDITNDVAQIAWKKYQIKTIVGVFEDLNLKAHSFDLITIRNTLEHVNSPTRMLLKINKVLKNDAFLFIEVPNVYHPRIKSVADFFGFQHLSNFSPATTNMYLEKMGFKLIKINTKLPYNTGMHILAKKIVDIDANHIEYKIKNEGKKILKLFENYKHQKKYFLKKINFKVRDIVKKSKEGNGLVIFGAGEHSSQLFETSNINLAKIIGFIDNNKKKQNGLFLNYKVYSVDKLPSLKPNIVLLSSYDNQNEMFDQIKDYQKLNIKIVKLYAKVISYDTSQI